METAAIVAFEPKQWREFPEHNKFRFNFEENT